MKTFLALVLLLVTWSTGGQVIQTTNMVKWSPGVPGGIPFYPIQNWITNNFGDTVPPAVGNGLTDCYAAISNCIARCTNGGAVGIPDGDFVFATQIAITYPKQVVLRGLGRTRSRLICTSTSGAQVGCINYGGDSTRFTSSITNGYTNGSFAVWTTNTSASAAGYAVGHLVRVRQSNDASVVFGNLSGDNYQAQMVQVTNVSGAVIGFNRPLYYTYGSSFSPWIECYRFPVTWCGLEDLTIENRGNCTNPVQVLNWNITAYCWAKNIVLSNSVGPLIGITTSLGNEVRHSRLAGHCTYSNFQTYAVTMYNHDSDCLIEDNVCYLNASALLCQQGSSGNVVSYNFSLYNAGSSYPTDTGLKGGFSSHGDNANNNLFEGNVVTWLGADESHGENHSETWFRNWALCYGYANPTNLPNVHGTGFYVDSTNNYFNVVGNVLGRTNDAWVTSANPNFQLGFARSILNNPPAAPVGSSAIASILYHGNYDFYSSTTNWSNGLTHTLYPTYYLSNTPAWSDNKYYPPRPNWWPTNRWKEFVFPPHGPDVSANGLNTNVTGVIGNDGWYITIPAMLMEFGMTDAVPSINIATQPSSQFTRTNTDVLFTSGGTGAAPVTYQWTSNGVDIAGATGTNLLFTVPINAHQATYAMRLTDANGSMTSTQAVLNVVLPMTMNGSF